MEFAQGWGCVFVAQLGNCCQGTTEWGSRSLEQLWHPQGPSMSLSSCPPAGHTRDGRECWAFSLQLLQFLVHMAMLLHLRALQSLGTQVHFVIPTLLHITFLWGHWGIEQANKAHYPWVVMLNPNQARCTEQRNETYRKYFLLDAGVRLLRFILSHLFLMVICKSPAAVLWTSLKKCCQTSHSQLRSLPALLSPVVGRLHQWGRFSGNDVSQPSSLYGCAVLHLFSAVVVYELFSWELSIDIFACSFRC